MTERRIYLPTPVYERRLWRVRLDAPRNLHGECDHTSRVIRLNPRDVPIEQLSTLLHEVSHAVRGDEETHVVKQEQATMIALRLAKTLYGEDLGGIDEQ